MDLPMSNEIQYQNNPLNGVSLKNMLTELVSHYGFDILHAYLNINCFKTNPSIDSSVKFLKKTDWAREKVEGFYMYDYKSFPRASSEQFKYPPRDRIIPEGQSAGEPAELSLEDAQQLQEKRAKKAAEYKSSGRGRPSAANRFSKGRNKPAKSNPDSVPAAGDPWANWKK
jgi:uncharacterized protein (DUF2132 family)